MTSDPDRPGRRWGSRLLYLGVFLFAVLVALAALSIYREWEQRIGQSRSEAIFQLVQGKTPARPTETPGATAWLNLELRRYRERIPDPEKARLYGEVAEWQDTRSVPPFFAPVRDLLASPLRRPAIQAPPVLHPPTDLGEPAALFSLRAQSYIELDHRWFAATRRTALDSRDLTDLTNPSNRFLNLTTPHLLALSAELSRTLRAHPLPALPGRRPPRVIRLYALSEDGTLVSLPLPQNRRAVLEEGREFRGSPERPTFVSNEFYFRFDFAHPESQTFYSGLYLDLGGQGLVATITAPLRDPALGEHGLVGADLAFDIDWEVFARRIDPPMIAGVVHLAEPPSRSHPWADLESAFSQGRPAALHRAVAALAGQRSGEEGAAESVPYVLHGVVEGQGAVAAFQVAATTWLVVLFPKTQSHLPLIPVLLSLVMLVALLWGFELNRRRAERAQEKAEAAFQEKQNLLSTMQVPLVVVDPNTDEVVFGNQAAEKLGVRAGARIGDMVSPDPRARAHYERMQVASPEPRRAYGVPLRVQGEDGQEEERYAIVRSVAVTAPIEALHADERHRLGILFLVEPEADLALLTAELADETRQDERRKLTGLLSHGVDTLIRVLAYSLRARSDAASSPELVSWLAEYVDRRLRTTAWLLDHWEAEPPLPPDSSIEAPQARATIERLAVVFALAANAPDAADLRARLHWDNGVLSERPSLQAPVFTVEIDWPEDYWFACPVQGGFGFFLGEVLINAIRHGRPGSTPALHITLDRVRRELRCEVENDLANEPMDRDGETYGGKSILRRLAHLFEWRDLRFERREKTYAVSWRVPASERGIRDGRIEGSATLPLAMKSFTLHAAALAVAVWALAAPARALPSPKDSWIEVHTASFTLFSDAGERKTREIGADLERLRDALSQLSPGLALGSPTPTYIFVFQDASSFRPYQRTYNGKPLDSGGYFLGRQLANYVAINGDQHGDEKAIIYHEYLHYLMHNNYAALPLWLHEGLAEYYSTFQVAKDEARIGLPIPEHVLWLRQHPFLPFATLFAVNEHSPEYNESSRRGGFYAESWALVHYMISGNPERRRQASEYLRLVQAGTPPDQIFAKAFGADPAALEHELRIYVQKRLFDYTRIPIHPEASLAMDVKPMARAEVLYRLGDLLTNLDDDHAADAGEHFRAALAVQPDHGLALAGLGFLAERADRPAEARPYYEKAAKLAPESFLAQYLYAESLIADPGPDSLRQARAALIRAVALRPDFGEAWARLGYTYQSEDELPPEAIRALETAHRLLPSRMDVAHNLSLAYARTGQPAKAEELIERVLVPQATPDQVESAREGLLDEEHRRAEELIGAQKLAEALPVLEAVKTKTSRPRRRAEIEQRIEEIRHTLNFNAFVERYNQAVELANRGKVQEAVAILEPLLETTQDPLQVQRARTLLEHLRPPKKKGVRR